MRRTEGRNMTGTISVIIVLYSKNSFLSYDNELSFWKNLLIKCYYNLKSIGVREDVNYGIDAAM